jgi:hypothetical protein
MQAFTVRKGAERTRTAVSALTHDLYGSCNTKGAEAPQCREVPPEARLVTVPLGGLTLTVLLESRKRLDGINDLVVGHTSGERCIHSLGKHLVRTHLCLLDRRNRDNRIVPHPSVGVK